MNQSYSEPAGPRKRFGTSLCIYCKRLYPANRTECVVCRDGHGNPERLWLITDTRLEPFDYKWWPPSERHVAIAVGAWLPHEE